MIELADDFSFITNFIKWPIVIKNYFIIKIILNLIEQLEYFGFVIKHFENYYYLDFNYFIDSFAAIDYYFDYY